MSTSVTPNGRAPGRVRLRDVPMPAVATGPDPVPAPPQTVPLQPLRVSGVVVRKADLIDALRVYVPALEDLQVTEDGDHFWLMLGDQPDANPPA